MEGAAVDEPLEREPARPAPADFEALYARHAPFVRRLLARGGVRSADLDDLTQEAFVIIHRLLPQFEGRSSVETWLHAIAWRVSASYRRRPHLRHEAPHATAIDAAVEANEGPTQWSEALRALWGRIDPEHRDLLALHHIGGFTIAQLSDLTGHARATIKKRIERGVRRVRGVTHDEQDVREGAGSGALGAQVLVTAASVRVMSCKQICVSTLDNVVLSVWRGRCSVEGLRAVGDAFAQAHAAWPSGFFYLSVVEPTSAPPKLEARQLHAELARTYGPKIRAAASVTESSTLMRLNAGILNAYFAIARTPVNNRFFSDVRSGVAWLAPQSTTAPARITAHIELMRAQLDPSA
jgi:RNA polymerase sigma-70 factor (ECF subfamily)